MGIQRVAVKDIPVVERKDALDRLLQVDAKLASVNQGSHPFVFAPAPSFGAFIVRNVGRSFGMECLSYLLHPNEALEFEDFSDDVTRLHSDAPTRYGGRITAHYTREGKCRVALPMGVTEESAGIGLIPEDKRQEGRALVEEWTRHTRDLALHGLWKFSDPLPSSVMVGDLASGDAVFFDSTLLHGVVKLGERARFSTAYFPG